MCVPIAAIGLGVAAVQAVSAHAAQKKQAAEQQNAENSRYNQVAAEASANYRANINSLSLQSEQQATADSQQAQEASAQVDQAIGSINARSGAAGVSGNSVDALIRDFTSLEASNESVMKTNATWRQAQIDNEIKGYQAGAQSQINSVTPNKVRSPSLLSLGLGLASAGVNAATAGINQLPPEQRPDTGWFFRPLWAPKSK